MRREFRPPPFTPIHLEDGLIARLFLSMRIKGVAKNFIGWAVKIWNWIKSHKIISVTTTVLLILIPFGSLVLDYLDFSFRTKSKLALDISFFYDEGFYYFSHSPDKELDKKFNVDELDSRGATLQIPVKFIFNNLGERTVLIERGCYNRGNSCNSIDSCLPIILLNSFNKFTMPIDDVYDRRDYPITIRPSERLEVFALVDISLSEGEENELLSLNLIDPHQCKLTGDTSLLLFSLAIWGLLDVPCPECGFQIEPIAVKSFSFSFALNDGGSVGGYSFPFLNLKRASSYINRGFDPLRFCKYGEEACMPQVKPCGDPKECHEMSEGYRVVRYIAEKRIQNKEVVRKIYNRFKKGAKKEEITDGANSPP